jgi:hypothetical protein
VDKGPFLKQDWAFVLYKPSGKRILRDEYPAHLSGLEIALSLP